MKSVLITGATGNLGQAVVERLAKAGYRVYATLGPSGELRPFNESPYQMQIQTEILNLTDEKETEAYVKAIVTHDPELEAAICLVGGWQPGTLAETTGVLLDKMINLNFKTAFNVARPLLDYFQKRGNGQFVFVGARPALRPADGKGQVAYALSKSLVFRLAEIINTLDKSGKIRAGVLVPSILDTPQNRRAMPDAATQEWVTPEAAADTIAFLLSATGGNFRETVVKIYNQA
ncbi:MAG: SDR family NAD(P)-dependent oxidoreductase [Saprospiraceae bacterium]